MAEEGNAKSAESVSPSAIRRETRSEAYLGHLDRILYGSSSHRNVMRTRSYSTNDSDDLEERLQQPEHDARRMSLTEMLLGRRSLFNATQSVVVEPLQEASPSTEALNEARDGLTMSAESQPEVQETSSEMDGDDVGENTQKEESARKTTQTDHLNKRLLDAFLSRISNITGGSNPGTVYKSDDPHENVENSGDYSTIYSDDLLMDRIYRRMNRRNGKNK